MSSSFGHATASDAHPTETIPVKKDPSVGKWEQHTKGIGSKLLAKMGWSGSGGLGSNRRRKKLNATSASTEATESSTATNSTTTTAKPDPSERVVPEDNHSQSNSNSNSTSTTGIGISRPIEVVVRPANLGLGYGNFKEMSQLKSNRIIEAQIRGLPLPSTGKKRRRRTDGEDDDDDNASDDGNNDTIFMSGDRPPSLSSAIPSTEELLNHKAWKRQKTKRVAPIIIPYEELIAQHEKQSVDGQPIIIDMRGPSAVTNTTSTTPSTPSLGQELLHNVTFILNTRENQLHSYTQLAKSNRLKVKSLESEIEGLKQQQHESQQRQEKLETALSIIGNVESISLHDGDTATALDNVVDLTRALGASLSAQDRETLKFWQVLAPALLSPILHKRLDRWDPLGPADATNKLLDSFFYLRLNSLVSITKGQEQVDIEGLRTLRQSILTNQLIPRIKLILESHRWDPSNDVDVVIDLYEYLQKLALESSNHGAHDNDGNKHDKSLKGHGADEQVFPQDVDDDDQFVTDKGETLSEIFRKELVLDTIYPKLQHTLTHWKPSLQQQCKLAALNRRLDLWILPWIPHLDHPAILPNLLSDCKRKLKSCMVYLQRTIGKLDDLDFVRASMDTLKPWVPIVESKFLHHLVSEYVTPYLARALSRPKVHSHAKEQDWSAVHLAFECHSRRVLSDIDFLSVLEGELLRTWACQIHTLLSDGKNNTDPNSSWTAAMNYLSWKCNVLVQPTTGSTKVSLERSIQLVRDDARICGIFYTVLRMIQSSSSSSSTTTNLDELEELRPPSSSSHNYQTVCARRERERLRGLEETKIRMETQSLSEGEARMRLKRRNIDTPTFRDVVEEFAKQHDILFQPRLGAKTHKDGKPIFLFGNAPIYIDGDVIYVSGETPGEWRPISLDELLMESSKKR